MKIFYQLRVCGQYQSFSGKGTFCSKKIFTDREKAEAHTGAFLDKCCGNGIMDIVRNGAKVTIIELEYEE